MGSRVVSTSGIEATTYMIETLGHFQPQPNCPAWAVDMESPRELFGVLSLLFDALPPVPRMRFILVEKLLKFDKNDFELDFFNVGSEPVPAAAAASNAAVVPTDNLEFAAVPFAPR